eukprot:703842_1
MCREKIVEQQIKISKAPDILRKDWQLDRIPLNFDDTVMMASDAVPPTTDEKPRCELDDSDLLWDAIKDFEERTKDDMSSLTVCSRRLEEAFQLMNKSRQAHSEQAREHVRIQDMITEFKEKNKTADVSPFIKRLEQAWTNESVILKQTRFEHDSTFLRFGLGKVNVRVWSSKDKDRLKEEYNKFKWRTAFIFLIFPIFQIFTNMGGRTVRMFHLLWMSYYYCTLSLRENVLRVNGSNIHPWWLWHHYISILMLVLVIIMEDVIVDEFMNAGFLWFFVFQGTVMLFQNVYQSKRHYARVATGKANVMDVGPAETLVEKPSNLISLVPLLYLTYILEIIIGGLMIATACTTGHGFSVSWKVLAQGIMWIAQGAGNSVTVAAVLMKKRTCWKDRQKILKNE